MENVQNKTQILLLNIRLQVPRGDVMLLLGFHVDYCMIWKTHSGSKTHYSYFHSWLSYGIILWATPSELLSVFLLQKRAVSAVVGTSQNNYKQLHCLQNTYSLVPICQFPSNHLRKSFHHHGTRTIKPFQSIEINKCQNNFVYTLGKNIQQHQVIKPYKIKSRQQNRQIRLLLLKKVELKNDTSCKKILKLNMSKFCID